MGMRRLEELEVREALEEQWGDEVSGEEEESDDEEEEEESDEESDEEEEEEELVGEIRQLSGGEIHAEKNRRVSWAFGEGEDPSLPPVNPRLELRFSHSEQPSSKASPLVGEQPAQPSDLAHFSCQAPKPILKPSTAPILVKEVESTEDEDDDEIPEPFEDPCSAKVLEKAPTEVDVAEEDSEEGKEEIPKRVSKFKAMRAGRK